MNVTPTTLAGVLIVEPKVFGDSRGFFYESYQRERYRAAGIPDEFVQDNCSRSRQGTLRGLHYQLTKPQGKLVSVTRGEVFDVAVDLRRSSPTFGKWIGVVLSEENHRQVYIPPGCAHGFCVTSDSADFTYKCTEFYHPTDERTLLWNDPALGIEWPIIDPAQLVLSDKDRHGTPLDRVETYR